MRKPSAEDDQEAAKEQQPKKSVPFFLLTWKKKSHFFLSKEQEGGGGKAFDSLLLFALSNQGTLFFSHFPFQISSCFAPLLHAEQRGARFGGVPRRIRKEQKTARRRSFLGRRRLAILAIGGFSKKSLADVCGRRGRRRRRRRRRRVGASGRV